MNAKIIALPAVCAAVVAAAVSGVVVWQKRENVAIAEANAAESREAKAKEDRKKSEAEARIAEANKVAEEAKLKAAEEARKAEKDRLEAAKIEDGISKRNKETAEANRKKAEAEAKAAADAKESEKIKAKASKDESDAAKAIADEALRSSELNAQAEADKLAREKLRSDAIVAEAKLLELRAIDFATIERQLIEYKQELDERERALHPDKTAADLAWVAEREADVVGGETNRLKKAEKILPENNPCLPRETRELAKSERIAKETLGENEARARASVTARLEELYASARAEGRVVDAEYYLKTLKSLYPDWEMRANERQEERK